MGDVDDWFDDLDDEEEVPDKGPSASKTHRVEPVHTARELQAEREAYKMEKIKLDRARAAAEMEALKNPPKEPETSFMEKVEAATNTAKAAVDAATTAHKVYTTFLKPAASITWAGMKGAAKLASFLGKFTSGKGFTGGALPSTDSTGALYPSMLHAMDGEGVKPKNELLHRICKAAYDATPPQKIDDLELVHFTPTLKFYVGPDKTVVVGIRGTNDWRDVRADALISVGAMEKSMRFRADVKELRKFQEQYPPTEYDYYACGHSLGGAILDGFLKRGLVKSGRSYNPALQYSNIGHAADNGNERVYSHDDRLGYLFRPLIPTSGPGAPEVRSRPTVDPRGIREAHNLDNFEGGSLDQDLAVLSNVLAEQMGAHATDAAARVAEYLVHHPISFHYLHRFAQTLGAARQALLNRAMRLVGQGLSGGATSSSSVVDALVLQATPDERKDEADDEVEHAGADSDSESDSEPESEPESESDVETGGRMPPPVGPDRKAYKHAKLYIIRSPNTPKVYIGSTYAKRIERRLQSHANKYKRHKAGKAQHYITVFDVIKHGSPTITLLGEKAVKTRAELEAWEAKVIARYKARLAHHVSNRNTPGVKRNAATGSALSELTGAGKKTPMFRRILMRQVGDAPPPQTGAFDPHGHPLVTYSLGDSTRHAVVPAGVTYAVDKARTAYSTFYDNKVRARAHLEAAMDRTGASPEQRAGSRRALETKLGAWKRDKVLPLVALAESEERRAADPTRGKLMPGVNPWRHYTDGVHHGPVTVLGAYTPTPAELAARTYTRDRAYAVVNDAAGTRRVLPVSDIRRDTDGYKPPHFITKRESVPVPYRAEIERPETETAVARRNLVALAWQNPHDREYAALAHDARQQDMEYNRSQGVGSQARLRRTYGMPTERRPPITVRTLPPRASAKEVDEIMTNGAGEAVGDEDDDEDDPAPGRALPGEFRGKGLSELTGGSGKKPLRYLADRQLGIRDRGTRIAERDPRRHHEQRDVANAILRAAEREEMAAHGRRSDAHQLILDSESRALREATQSPYSDVWDAISRNPAHPLYARVMEIEAEHRRETDALYALNEPRLATRRSVNAGKARALQDSFLYPPYNAMRYPAPLPAPDLTFSSPTAILGTEFQEPRPGSAKSAWHKAKASRWLAEEWQRATPEEIRALEAAMRSEEREEMALQSVGMDRRLARLRAEMAPKPRRVPARASAVEVDAVAAGEGAGDEEDDEEDDPAPGRTLPPDPPAGSKRARQ